jgi:hypothetical protein
LNPLQRIPIHEKRSLHCALVSAKTHSAQRCIV